MVTPDTVETKLAADMMDWEPITTAAAAIRAQRAQWVPQEILNKRKETGRCLRCGEKGHLMRQCTLLPAIRPRREKKISVVSAVADEAEDDSGKE